MRRDLLLTGCAMACAWMFTIHASAAEPLQRPQAAVAFGEQEEAAGPIHVHEGGAAGFATGIASGAEHVISLQCPNGGWGWPHGDCGTTFHNITGPICLGLLHAYETTGDPDFLAAAVAGGDFALTGTFAGSGDTSFGAFTPYFFDVLSTAAGDSAYADNAAEDFFDRLTAGTYGDAAGSACSSVTWFPGDTYDWIGRLQCLRSGTLVNLRPWDLHLLPAAAAGLGNPDSSTPADGVSQQQAFAEAVLDGLDTLVQDLPAGYFGDLIGLAGGVRGLGLIGQTSFAAISSPDHPGIDGMTSLQQLADYLASLQNADGSWHWRSDDDPAPDETDKDTQTTAYAALALLAADPHVASDYADEIELARQWIRTMQLPGGGFLSYPGGDENIEIEAEAVNALAIAASVALVPDDDCYMVGDTVTVTIELVDAADTIVGGQFFLDYDTAALTFDEANPGGAPFTSEIFECSTDKMTAVACVPMPGLIDYAVGIPLGGSGTQSDTTMAVLTFTAASEICDVAGLVAFRPHDPPTRLTNAAGADIVPSLADLPAITIDSTAPMITCPADITVSADAGGCDADVAISPASAVDDCDGSPEVVGVRSDALPLTDPYPAGVTMITWTATDDCGNSDDCVQTVTVNAVNQLVVDLEYPGLMSGVSRCITFELHDCLGPPVVVEQEILFTGGFADDVLVEVPCGDYACITARDTLHTLRRTDLDDFGIAGSQYAADFTGSDALVGGNLNDDPYIDILDFGTFVGQFGLSLPAPTCATAAPHSDIDGDGAVGLGDYTFIQINFLQVSEAACCIVGPLLGGPRHRIAVRTLNQLGLDHLRVSDLNHDGWLDEKDVAMMILTQ